MKFKVAVKGEIVESRDWGGVNADLYIRIFCNAKSPVEAERFACDVVSKLHPNLRKVGVKVGFKMERIQVELIQKNRIQGPALTSIYEAFGRESRVVLGRISFSGSNNLHWRRVSGKVCSC